MEVALTAACELRASPWQVASANIAIEFGGSATVRHGKTASFERVGERTAPCKGYFRLSVQDYPENRRIFSLNVVALSSVRRGKRGQTSEGLQLLYGQQTECI